MIASSVVVQRGTKNLTPDELALPRSTEQNTVLVVGSAGRTGRLADAIGVTIAHEPSRVEGVGPGELWAVMLDTRATFDGLVHRYAKDPTQAEEILANRFYRNLSGALSGTQEYMAAEKLQTAAADAGHEIKVETQGSIGAENVLTAADIAAAADTDDLGA